MRTYSHQEAELLRRLVMQLEVEEVVAAQRWERCASRSSQRNGYRARSWETLAREIPLRIPNLRHGSYFKSFLEPGRPTENAPLAVGHRAHVNPGEHSEGKRPGSGHGAWWHRPEQGKRICQELDEAVQVFLDRPLDHEYPYPWLDGIRIGVRHDEHIVNRVLVIAIGIRESGEQAVVGWSQGGSEEHAFGQELSRSLAKRGLYGTELVTSDAHVGLKVAALGVLERLRGQPSWVRYHKRQPHSTPPAGQVCLSRSTTYARM